MHKLTEFLGNLWLGFAILGAIVGGIAPFAMLLWLLYEILK